MVSDLRIKISMDLSSKRILRLYPKAQAIAALWHCPTESCEGKKFNLSDNSNLPVSSLTLLFTSENLLCAYLSGSAILSSTVI